MSALLALAPASLLAWNDALFCDWFAVVAAWSMWPLLVVDRLQVAYACTITVFSVCASMMRQTNLDDDESLSWIGFVWNVLCKISIVAMLALHAFEICIDPPSHLPDLFPVLWSIGGCALCCLAWAKTFGSLASRLSGLGNGKLKDD